MYILHILMCPPRRGVQVKMVLGYSRVPYVHYSKITKLFVTCPTPPGCTSQMHPTWEGSRLHALLLLAV